MEIPLNAKVVCQDGVCGKSLYVLINPVTKEVTDLVVEGDFSAKNEFIVPLNFVAEVKAGTIHLNCRKAELEKLDPFIKTSFINEDIPAFYYKPAGGMVGMGAYYVWPYVTPAKSVKVPVEEEQIPPGELAVQRGTRVKATDGFVGKVDEFVVNPDNNHITHMIMREGHLWGHKDVIIPLSEIATTGEETVTLKIDKHQIEALPTFPVKRHWS